MEANELRKLSERWGVELQGFENLIIPLQGSIFRQRRTALKIAKVLERKGYRLGNLMPDYPSVIYCKEEGTYFFGESVRQLTGFKFANCKDVCGEQIIDKNLFYGFIYGFAFGVLLMLILWWIL